MRYARYVFAIAGIYGLLVSLPLYFNEKQFAVDHPPAVTHPEFYYGFAGLCVAWQVLFLIIATDPIRYRPAMIAGILEKVSFVLAVVPLFLLGRTELMFVGAAAADAFFAVAFGVAYYSCKPKTAPEPIERV